MKGRNLLVLLVAAGILIGLAVRTTKDNGRSQPEQLGRNVFTGLPVNEVQKLTVLTPQATVTVARVNETWVAPQVFNYPCDFARVRRLLIKLSDLKIGDVLRATDEQRATMKMNSPATAGVSPEKAGTLLTLSGKDDKQLASLLVGESRKRPSDGGPQSYGNYPDGLYVSPDEGKTVYLVGEMLEDINGTAKDWLDRDLLNLSAADIRQISIVGPGSEKVEIARSSPDAKLEVTGLAEDEETDVSKMYSVEGALSYVRFDDVADPSLAANALGMDNPVRYSAVTKNGQVYDVLVGNCVPGTSNRYVRLHAALTAPPPQPAGTNVTSEALEKERKQREDNEKAVTEFNEKVSPWTYVVAEYKASSFLKTRQDLTKKKEKKGEPTPETNAVPNAAAAPATESKAE